MAYVVVAKWIANEGEEAAVAAAIEALVEPSRAEPGNLVYQPHRDPQDPRVFMIYEQYADEQASAARAAPSDGLPGTDGPSAATLAFPDRGVVAKRQSSAGDSSAAPATGSPS